MEKINEQQGYWFNFAMGEYELRDTPTDFAAYIPQTQAAQGMYRLLSNDMGEPAINAALRVLEACCGKSSS